jgi:hypothetical protein
MNAEIIPFSRPLFQRYIGIDYSGAEAPTSSLKGLRVYLADRVSSPLEVQPPPSPRKYWTRRGLAEWLVERLSEDQPTIVGIDPPFLFHCDISKSIIYCQIGRYFWTTSKAIGPPTKISMLILCGTVLPATGRPAPAKRDGSA